MGLSAEFQARLPFGFGTGWQLRCRICLPRVGQQQQAEKPFKTSILLPECCKPKPDGTMRRVTVQIRRDNY